MDWIQDYQDAYLRANPEKQVAPEIVRWTTAGGWWLMIIDGSRFKYRKKQILEMTQRLRAKAGANNG